MGFKALKPTFFLAGFFMCLTILMIFWTEFVLKPDSKDYLIWVLLGVSSIVSILLGKLSMETVQIGASLLGIWLAIVISFIL